MNLLFLFAFAFSIDIPKNLNHEDRKEVLQILGVGTSSKYNSIPEPLGGFSGFELGISIESIPIEDLNALGDGVNNKDRFEYSKISIGKGLFHHIDVYAHFIPFDEQTGLSEYGALLRWGAYEHSKGYFSVAALAHFNSSNIEDLFISDSYGAQLHLVWHLGNIDLYGGIGRTHIKGRFKGGPNAITDSGVEETEKTKKLVRVSGLSFAYQKYFLAIEVNESEYLSLAAKLGLRF